MKCKLLVSMCVVAAVLWGCCLSSVRANPVRELESNLAFLNELQAELNDDMIQNSVPERVTNMLQGTIWQAKYSLSMARLMRPGVSLDRQQRRNLAGCLIASNPSRVADDLVAGNPKEAILLIKLMPGMVSLDAREVARGLGLGGDVMALAGLVAQHNSWEKGHAPADLLPLVPNGKEYAEAIWAGKTYVLLPD